MKELTGRRVEMDDVSGKKDEAKRKRRKVTELYAKKDPSEYYFRYSLR